MTRAATTSPVAVARRLSLLVALALLGGLMGLCCCAEVGHAEPAVAAAAASAQAPVVQAEACASEAPVSGVAASSVSRSVDLPVVATASVPSVSSGSTVLVAVPEVGAFSPQPVPHLLCVLRT